MQIIKREGKRERRKERESREESESKETEKMKDNLGGKVFLYLEASLTRSEEKYLQIRRKREKKRKKENEREKIVFGWKSK